jgi:hypothetical protein
MGILAGIDTFTGWTLLQNNGSAIESAYAAANNDTSNIAYFKSIAPTLTTPQALLNNYRALLFVTTAFGLGSEVNQTAILSKLMTQNPNAPGSLAQQLADNRYRNFAGALSNWSPPPFSNPTALANLISDYQANAFETEVGQDNGTLQEALYFQKNAVGATTITQLMADPALLTVVETAEGIPSDAFGNLDYNQQLAILTSRVNMKQFSTQAGVNAYVQKFLAMNEVQNITNGSATANPLLALFGVNTSSGSSDTSSGISLSGISDTSSGLDLTI